jgi:hypothetical protein
MAQYRAGVCNIGPRGRLVRWFAGLVFFGLAYWAFGYLPPELGVQRTAVLTILLWGGFVSAFEALFSFCVVLGTLGRYETEPGRGRVVSESNRRADFWRAQALMLAGLLWAIFLAVLLERFIL